MYLYNRSPLNYLTWYINKEVQMLRFEVSIKVHSEFCVYEYDFPYLYNYPALSSSTKVLSTGATISVYFFWSFHKIEELISQYFVAFMLLLTGESLKLPMCLYRVWNGV